VLEREKAALTGRVSELTSSVHATQREVSRRDDRIGQLEKAVSRRDDRIGQLEKAVSRRDDRIGQLEGVVRSFKRRLPYRIYVSTKRTVRRWCVQWPTFGCLFFLNLVMNIYSRHHGPRLARKMQNLGITVDPPHKQPGDPM